jgi:hypothetical protein
MTTAEVHPRDEATALEAELIYRALTERPEDLPHPDSRVPELDDATQRYVTGEIEVEEFEALLLDPQSQRLGQLARRLTRQARHAVRSQRVLTQNSRVSTRAGRPAARHLFSRVQRKTSSLETEA